jgi:hypothetical protein
MRNNENKTPKLTTRTLPLLVVGCCYTDKKDILVPLTNSLYVKGKLSQPDRVIVDVGTGFFVEKVRSIPTYLSTHLNMPMPIPSSSPRPNLPIFPTYLPTHLGIPYL